MIKEQLPDIYPYTVTVSTPEELMNWAVGAGIFVAAVLGIYLLWRWYTSAERPAWERAIAEINALEVESEGFDGVAFYRGLTRVVRWYCYVRFVRDFRGKSDRELSLFLLQREVGGKLGERLSDFLRRAASTRFSGTSVSQDQAIADRDLIISFVRASIPQADVSHVRKD
jgi:hypothetical protein